MYQVTIPVQLPNNNFIHLFILFNLLIPNLGISTVGDVNSVTLIVITLYESSSDPRVNVCLCRGRTLQQGERQVLQWPQVCTPRSGRSEMRWQPPIQREPLCSRNQTSLESNSLRQETQLSVLSFYFDLHSIVCGVTMLLVFLCTLWTFSVWVQYTTTFVEMCSIKQSTVLNVIQV